MKIKNTGPGTEARNANALCLWLKAEGTGYEIEDAGYEIRGSVEIEEAGHIDWRILEHDNQRLSRVITCKPLKNILMGVCFLVNPYTYAQIMDRALPNRTRSVPTSHPIQPLVPGSS